MSSSYKTNSTVAGNSAMDASTAAYVEAHELTFFLQSITTLLRASGDDFAPAALSSNAAPHGVSPSPSLPSPSDSSDSRGAGGESLDTTLALQLMLSTFGPLPLPTNAPSGGAGRAPAAKAASPSTSPPPMLSEVVRDTAGLGGSAAAPPPPPACLWPADATFPTRDAAVKAEICRCLAQYCERLHCGAGLLESYGGQLSFADVCPSLAAGQARLAVALALETFRCWRQVLVPLLLATGELGLGAETTESAAADALFDAVVGAAADTAGSAEATPAKDDGRGAATSPPPFAGAAVAAVCSHWCCALLHGYCADFPTSLWGLLVSAARNAAAAQQALRADTTECLLLPPLTSEAVLQRSFLAHVVCTPRDASGGVSSAAEMVQLAKARCPAWAWEEVGQLHGAVSARQLDRSDEESWVTALLLADSYWAAFQQPYTAMFVRFYL